MTDKTQTPTIENSLAQIQAEMDILGESSLVDELLITEISVLNIRQHLDNIRKRLAEPVHLVIDNDGGVLHDIDIFRNPEQAEEHFRTATGFTYAEVSDWEKADRSYDLGIDRSAEFDVQIWEVKIKGDT